MSTILVINPGSVTKKYTLFHKTKPVLGFLFENTASGYERRTHTEDCQEEYDSITEEIYQDSFAQVSGAVQQYLTTAQIELDVIAIRVVAPGKEFQTHKVIDSAYVSELRERQFSMPLHIPFILREIQNSKQDFPSSKLVAISDSAFHATLPKRARDFSIDQSDAEIYDIYRFGYHGLSVASVLPRIHPLTGKNPSRIVVCHVGSGVSVTAIKDGQSVDTSMGYSPSSGLPMGSQVGDIDPGGLLQLMREKNLKPSEAQMYINTKGGLYGLSETSDIRLLLDRQSRGDAIAIQTLDLFLYHIQKEIAASTVALEGLDMLVLTGTACTRSSEIRSQLLQRLQHIGIVFDESRNEVLVGRDGVCSAKDSPVKVVTIRTDEMAEMARIVDTLNLSNQ